jgi:hypothetical protein
MRGGSKMRTPHEWTQAIDHVVYEYANLVSSGDLLSKPLKPPVNTHVQDAFLLGCRKVADFFLNRSKPDDVKARDYLTKGRVPKIRLSEWKRWHAAMVGQLAHITYERVGAPQSWDGSRNPVLLAEFRKEWRTFLSHLEEPYRTEFENAIKTRKKSEGFRNLDLN